MKFQSLWLGVFIVFLCSCTHLSHPVSVEERNAIQEEFKKAVIEFVTHKEGRELVSLDLGAFEQTADNDVRVAYQVACRKNLDGGEKANSTFQATVKLHRRDDGVWHAIEMQPQGLTLEFSKGLEIRPPAVKSSK